jgi:sarcosine oxidase subunit beta
VTDLPRRAEVVIIGGGVMGASAAYHLALAGQRDVVLLEAEAEFGLGATGRCAGGVRYQFATEINIRLSIASLAMLETLADETGVDPQYRKCGYLFALTSEAEVADFQAHVALQRRLGVQTEWLSGDEVRRRLPLMRFDDALAGTFHARDGLADPHSVVTGYLQGARRLGVLTFADSRVKGLDVAGGRVRSVNTERGEIGCAHILIAAGPWAAEVGRMAGIEIPILPVRRQMLVTTPVPGLPADFPFVIDFAQSLYFHREGGGILTGMSNVRQAPGFDQSVDPDWELQAMEAALQRMPALESVGRLSAWAGLYEVTPDAHPIFGPTPVSGLWIVAGFSGHGFMHGPVAGRIMAEYLLEGSPRTVDVTALDLARFNEGRPIVETNVI